MELLEWRSCLITSIFKEINIINKKYKNSVEALKNIEAKRKEQLNEIMEHMNGNLSSTFMVNQKKKMKHVLLCMLLKKFYITLQKIVGDALPFVKLTLTSDEEYLQLTSSIQEEATTNAINTKHFNTLLNFMSVLAMFLELVM